MEPIIYLGILLAGLLLGAMLAGLLLRGGREAAAGAGDPELAELKARAEEREAQLADLQEELEKARTAAAEMQKQLLELAAARAAADERAARIPQLEEALRGREAAAAALQDRLQQEAAARAAAEQLAARLPELESALKEKEQAAAALQDRLAEAEARTRELQARMEEIEKQQAEKLALLEQAQQKLAETFRGAAAEALQKNNESFFALAQADQQARLQALNEMLKPLEERLESIQKEGVELYAGLAKQFQLLQEAQKEAAGQTRRLVDALRTPAVRGRWGEMQLRRVVEMAGMVEHCDFEEQVSVDGEDGRLRPDMIIRLPNEREIVVDAKVPLAAYLASLEETDEEKRRALQAEHARQVREHVQRLSAKAYWDQFQRAPDFVVAFLPGETFFSAALQHDSALIEFGAERRVLLATPTTLIALLKAVAYGWKQQRLAKNAQEISDLGRELYERLCVFVDRFDGVRAGLERAVQSYNEAAGSLERRVLVTARKFRDLGAAAERELEGAGEVEKTLRQLQAPELEEADRLESAEPHAAGAGD